MKLKLRYKETVERSALFSKLAWCLMEARHPNSEYIEPDTYIPDLGVTLASINQRDVECAAYSDGMYDLFLSYHIISTVPESGISRICNKIKNIGVRNRGKIRSATICISQECPRDSLRKVEEVSVELGGRGILFEFLEAKSFRLQLEKHFGVKCFSFETEHTKRVLRRLKPEAVMELGLVKDEKEDPIKLGRLFICHASEDKPFVTKLVKVLDKHAEHVWYDSREILVGDSITEKVSDGLTKADYLVVVLSTTSVSKKWVNRELSYALNKQLSGSGFTVIPVLIEDCGIPPLISDLRFADFRESFTIGVNQVIGSIQKMRKK